MKIVVTKNGYALEYVPENLKSEKICEIAVAQNIYALRYIPIEKRSKKICEIAVPQNRWTLKVVSVVVAQSGLTLKFVPKKL